MARYKTVKAWAWEWNSELCFWAEPSKADLIRRGKPTPEARPVCVRMILNKDYLKLIPVKTIKRRKK